MPVQPPMLVVFVHGLHSSARVWEPFTLLIRADPDLAGSLEIQYFTYASPFVRLRPSRRIPDIDDLADQFQTFLATSLRSAGPLIVVTHSQGGLIVQRFLSRSLARGDARSLARIKRIVMFSCPNSGSEYLLSLRRRLWVHPQEADLRPISRAVTETQSAVLAHVVNARGCSDTECHIPIVAYGGTTDKIVTPTSSNFVFPEKGLIEGDHSSVVRPGNRDSASFLALRAELLAALKPASAAEDLPDDPGERVGVVSVAPPYGRRDARLVGRDALIAAVMSREAPRRVHVLAGLGGSGKSRLALEIAHLAERQGRRVWWISANRVNSGMREVANQLGAPEKEVDRAWRGAGSPTDLAWRFLDASAGKWLVVFDNADDPESLGPGDGEVSTGTGWLRAPAADNGLVIVTSRDRNQAAWGQWSTVHSVHPLDVDDGASVLMNYVYGEERTEDERSRFEQARLLSVELGGLPLALRAAASYIKSVGSSRVWAGGTGIRDFESYRAAVQERFATPLTPARRDLDESLGFQLMRNVSDLSLDHLAQRELPQAAPLLRLLACLSIAPVPYHVLLSSTLLAQSALLTNLSPIVLRAVLEGLDDLGLVDLHSLAGVDNPDLSHVLSVHPVVHGILRGDEDVRRHRADYYGLAVQLLLTATATADPDYPENWAVWHALAPHAVEVATAALLGGGQLRDRKVQVSAIGLARLTSRYLIVSGLLAPARELVLPIIDGCETFGFSADSREILSLRHEKGRIALEGGDPQAAEAELRDVIAGRERALGVSDPDTLASRHKLSKAILEQGRWAEAEREFREIVQAEQQVRGPEHADTMVVRHSLARAILSQGRAAEAEELMREILEVRYRIWSRTTPETLFARHTLGRCLLEQEKADEAEAEVRGALAEAAGQHDAPTVLGLRQTLTTVLLLKGQVSEAITDLEGLRDARRRVLGPTHPETLRTEQMLRKTRGEIPPDDQQGD